MMTKATLHGLVLFIVGFVLAAVCFPGGGDNPVGADQYSCIRSDLHAQGMTGNIPEPSFTITYDIPNCYEQNGYIVKKVYMYGRQVAILYEKQ